MTTEEKKRSRPTWAMVRALEARVRNQEEEIEGLLKERLALLSDVERHKAAADRWSLRVIELESRGFWARLLNRD